MVALFLSNDDKEDADDDNNDDGGIFVVYPTYPFAVTQVLMFPETLLCGFFLQVDISLHAALFYAIVAVLN
jgi:hypothetical protein